MPRLLQLYPVPIGAAVQTSMASVGGFNGVYGTYDTSFLQSLLGLGANGPTPFTHTCPAGAAVLGIDVSGRGCVGGSCCGAVAAV